MEQITALLLSYKFTQSYSKPSRAQLVLKHTHTPTDGIDPV